MNFVEFCEYVEMYRLERDNKFPRKEAISLIFENTEKWSSVIKALLLKNPVKYISVNYLQEKLNFIKRNYTKPYLFLDYKGIEIYKILNGGIINLKSFPIKFSKYGLITNNYFRSNSEIVNWFLAKKNYINKRIMKYKV